MTSGFESGGWVTAHGTCRLCGSGETRFLFALEHEGMRHTVLECRACDVLQTMEHYQDVSPDYVDLGTESVDRDRLWCQGVHKEPAFEHWYLHTEKFLNTNNSSKKLLDIGCGTGGFLRFARSRGIEVFGFDASRAQVAHAKKEMENVRCAVTPEEYLEVLERKDLQFDLVTMWDVLEHVRKPIDFLISIRRLIRPGGCLFISIPNGRAMFWKQKVYMILGRDIQQAWVPWEHVFYYSPRSLGEYLGKTGFHLLKIGSVPCYPRPLSTFEVMRRVGFACLRPFPSWAPQIFAWARVPLESDVQAHS